MSKEQLEREVIDGELHQRIWTNTVEPFFIRKQKELFDAFLRTHCTDGESLKAIRMQSNALQSLKAEFDSYIQTGKMASETLSQEE